jgi:hypothetical protein
MLGFKLGATNGFVELSVSAPPAVVGQHVRRCPSAIHALEVGETTPAAIVT